MLENLEIDEYCTDNWTAFTQVFAGENHRVGKDITRAMEEVNNALRARNRHFVQKTACFSKKDLYHQAVIKIIFQQRNYDYLSYILNHNPFLFRRKPNIWNNHFFQRNSSVLEGIFEVAYIIVIVIRISKEVVFYCKNITRRNIGLG